MIRDFVLPRPGYGWSVSGPPRRSVLPFFSSDFRRLREPRYPFFPSGLFGVLSPTTGSHPCTIRGADFKSRFPSLLPATPVIALFFFFSPTLPPRLSSLRIPPQRGVSLGTFLKADGLHRSPLLLTTSFSRVDLLGPPLHRPGKVSRNARKICVLPRAYPLKDGVSIFLETTETRHSSQPLFPFNPGRH